MRGLFTFLFIFILYLNETGLWSKIEPSYPGDVLWREGHFVTAYLTGDSRFHLIIFGKQRQNKKEGVWGFFHLQSAVYMNNRKQSIYLSRDFQESSFFSFSVLMMTCTSYHNDYLKSLFGFEEVVSALGVLSL